MARRFTQRDLDRMFAIRDIEGLTWREIAEQLGRTAATCCWTYHHYHAKLRLALAREHGAAPVAKPPAKRSGRPARRITRPFKARASRADAPLNRPRYFHDADMDLRGRIDRQGITAGLCGDPPPGRSALDQRGRA